MPDREKVIKGLETCIEHEDCGDCPYVSTCVDPIDFAVCLMKDALTLLKEQESATEFILDDYQPTCKICGLKPFVGYIPKIEWMKERGYKYCPGCGRAVKWNGDKRNSK